MLRNFYILASNLHRSFQFFGTIPYLLALTISNLSLYKIINFKSRETRQSFFAFNETELHASYRIVIQIFNFEACEHKLLNSGKRS